jgi:hypothetical protein
MAVHDREVTEDRLKLCRVRAVGILGKYRFLFLFLLYFSSLPSLAMERYGRG